MKKNLHIASVNCLLIVAVLGCNHTYIHLKDPNHKSKIAILVIPGHLYGAEGKREMGKWFEHLGYDVYIPDYESRDGLEQCVRNLASFIEENSIEDYDQLYVLAYILGGWTFNSYLKEHSLPNLNRIVYIRSHFEERLAKIALDNIPLLTKMAHGSTTYDMRDIPYPPLEKQDRQIGLIIESRAVPYLRRHKQEVLALGDIDWSPESFNQEYDDFSYVWLYHNEMYSSFDVIGPELIHFYRHGKFSDNARRVPFEGDPFAKD